MAEVTTVTAETKTDAATSQATTETAATTLLSAAESTTEQTSSTETQATKTATETAKAATETETKTEEKKPEGAPEKYEFKDADKFDATVLGSFTEAAKAANLSQDAAQKLLETMAPKLAERQVEQVKAVQKQWFDESSSDKEFGGDKLKENLGTARKALDTFGTPELRTFLEASGLGSHPDVIRLLYRVGKAISEDKFVTGSPGGTSTVDTASVLYDKTPSAKE